MKKINWKEVFIKSFLWAFLITVLLFLWDFFITKEVLTGFELFSLEFFKSILLGYIKLFITIFIFLIINQKIKKNIKKELDKTELSNGDHISWLKLFAKSLSLTILGLLILFLWLIHLDLGLTISDILHSSWALFSFIFIFVLIFGYAFKDEWNKLKSIKISNASGKELRKEYAKELILKIILFFIKLVVVVYIWYLISDTLNKGFGREDLTGIGFIDIFLAIGYYSAYIFIVINLFLSWSLVKDWFKLIELKNKISNGK